MKKNIWFMVIFAIVLIISIVLAFVLYEKEEITALSFNYQEDMQAYKPGMAGVKTDAFINTTQQHIETAEEAIACAKAECTVEYDSTLVWYDKTEKMWAVLFHRQEWLGGGQTIYMTDKGITKLIIYGE